MGSKGSPLGREYVQRERHSTHEDAASDAFQVSGSVRWFDPSKGYGFIVPDQDLPDVLLHVTCLRREGFQTAPEGARIVCDVVRRPKGLQAFRIHAMDASTAVHPSQLPQRTHVVVIPDSEWERGTVKWFNRIRGYGFLTRGPGTADIFVHMETLATLRLDRTASRTNGARSLRQGTRRLDCSRTQARKCRGTVLQLRRSSNFGKHELTAIVNNGDPVYCAGTMARHPPLAPNYQRPSQSPNRILRAKINSIHTGGR